MSGLLDVVLCFHHAFRRDMREIDGAVFQAARNGTDSLARWIDFTLYKKG